jgi:16S rRNA (uracil1498-N3)-methyltransferase
LAYQFKTRIYSESALAENAKVLLTSKQSHKIINVLRMKTNEDIVIFNSNCGEWLGNIIIQKSIVTVVCNKIIKQAKKESGPSLIFSPIKQVRTDWLIEKATECGVENLLPSLMKRTVVRKVNLERLRNNTIGAAEQTGRMSIPHIEPLRDYKEQIEYCENLNKTIIFCDELRMSPIITEFYQELNPKDIALVIGPEGGFDDSERDYIQTNIENLIECSLGPRVYRAETAALVALALFQ